MIYNTNTTSSSKKIVSIFDIPSTKADHEAIIMRLRDELEAHEIAFETMWSSTNPADAVSASEMAAPTAVTNTVSDFRAYEQEPVIPGIDLDAPPPSVDVGEEGRIINTMVEDGVTITIRVSRNGQGLHTRWRYDADTNSLVPPTGNGTDDLDKDFQEGARATFDLAASSSSSSAQAPSTTSSSSSSSTSGRFPSPPSSERAARRTSPYARPVSPSINNSAATASSSAGPAPILSSPRPLRRETAVTLIHTRFEPVWMSKNLARATLGDYEKPRGVKSVCSHFVGGRPRPEAQTGTSASSSGDGSTTGKGKKRPREDEEDNTGESSTEEHPRKRSSPSEDALSSSSWFTSPVTESPSGRTLRITLRDPATDRSTKTSSSGTSSGSSTPTRPRSPRSRGLTPLRRSPRKKAGNDQDSEVQKED